MEPEFSMIVLPGFEFFNKINSLLNISSLSLYSIYSVGDHISIFFGLFFFSKESSYFL